MTALSTHTGQIHTLILIDYIMKKGFLVNLDIVTETGITHIHHQKHQNQYNQANHHYQNNSDAKHNAPNMSTLNILELIHPLQSQIIGFQLQPLQQATLNSINTFDGSKKAEFTTWNQSIENAMIICNLVAINIILSK